MGTTLGDALARKGLVTPKVAEVASEATRKVHDEQEARRRAAWEAEQRALEKAGKDAADIPVPPEWLQE